jgi:5-methylcytosine-specific restriction endonuclease McrA
MDKATESRVRARADGRCEYCLLPEQPSRLPFVVDHVIAKQHGGGDEVENLALACGFCNRHKGPNVAGIDPLTRELTRLFDPRRDLWADHFRWERVNLVGTTAVGRTTVMVLAMNHPDQLAVREMLLDEGIFRAMA